jgi:tRNA1(Val) A37 N6-methylase TrmN6
MPDLAMNYARPEYPTEFSCDAFHRGRFFLVQPQNGGHRSGIDAMMLAAAVPDGFSGHCADIGAGAGAAGLAVLSRLPNAQVTLFENDARMTDCARQSLLLAENADFVARARIIEADVTLRGNAREAAGLLNNQFDFAIFNPPFNDAADRQTPDAIKANAHVMRESMFEDWFRTVAAIVRQGGGMALIARPQSLGDILNATGNRFGALEIIPIHPHAEAAAIRLIVRGVKGSRARLNFLPAHVLHAKGAETFLEKAEAVNNGVTGL